MRIPTSSSGMLDMLTIRRHVWDFTPSSGGDCRDILPFRAWRALEYAGAANPGLPDIRVIARAPATAVSATTAWRRCSTDLAGVGLRDVDVVDHAAACKRNACKAACCPVRVNTTGSTALTGNPWRWPNRTRWVQCPRPDQRGVEIESEVAERRPNRSILNRYLRHRVRHGRDVSHGHAGQNAQAKHNHGSFC